MGHIPKELIAPKELFEKLRNKALSEEILKYWEKIAEDFELLSASPTWAPPAKIIAANIAEHIIELSGYRRTEFNYPSTVVECIKEEDLVFEVINEETGLIALHPDCEWKSERLITEEDKKLIFQTLRKLINRFKVICNGLGYSFDLDVPEEVIKALTYLEINNIFLIEFASRNNFSDVLHGCIPKHQWKSLKIVVSFKKGEAAYFFERIKDSGKLPIIDEMIKAGVFYWKGEELNWKEMAKQKSVFTTKERKDDKKTQIAEKVDEILALI